jgi:hypothetical protein
MTTGYGLEDGGGRSSRSGRVKNLLHAVQTSSEAHLASFPVGSRDSIPGGKAAEA